MYSYLSQEIPVVCISNTAESFFAYAQRETKTHQRTHLIREMQGLGDRALFYPTASKLVVLSYSVSHKTLIQQRYGYQDTDYLTPQTPSPFLSLDILREQYLLAAIVQYAGIQRILQLIPHATTPQFLRLVESLRQDYQLTILIPESSSAECLWLRDYIDTKSGFHTLAAPWLSDKGCQLPLAISCRTCHQAAAAAYWFSVNQRSCIVKADQGNDALGHTVIQPGQFISITDLLENLQENPFLQEDLILVEEYIAASENLFPSIELFVPPLLEGKPQVAYTCNQLFSIEGRFAGLLIDRHLQQASWYPALEEAALTIAAELQSMGYVGHFDLDAIIDNQENVFLLEINARRTGGTHVHEIAHYLLGKNYLDNVVALSNTTMNRGKIIEFQDLQTTLESLFFPMHHQSRGIIITHTSNLSDGTFGYVILASSQADALSLQQEMINKIETYVEVSI